MAKAYFYENAHYFRISGDFEGDAPEGKRGKVTEFSTKSRRRVLAKVNQIDRSLVFGRPLFITLTYPSVYSPDSSRWKRDLDTFSKAFLRQHPACVMFWRMEFQKRGAPHYHLLAFNVSKFAKPFNRNDIIPWVSNSWYRIVGSNDPKHLAAGTNCAFIRTWRGVVHYVSKYMTKPEQEALEDVVSEGVGRFWGICNRKYLPIKECVIELDIKEFFYLRRIMRHLLSKKIRRKVHIYNSSAGFALYIDYETSLKLIDQFDNNGMEYAY